MKHSDEWLKEHFGYRFKNKELLEAALTHRSADRRHNERLEFLGDSVLSAVISDVLFQAVPDATEGELSRIRASLVNGQTLGEIASGLALGVHLNLGSGELKSGGFRRPSILADALEAVLGAIYLDGGYDAAAASIHRIFCHRLDRLPSGDDLKDPKTRLQEYLQARGQALPNYSVLATRGEPHDRTFSVVCDADEYSANGVGKSRRQAEQDAARCLLEQLENV